MLHRVRVVAERAVLAIVDRELAHREHRVPDDEREDAGDDDRYQPGQRATEDEVALEGLGHRPHRVLAEQDRRHEEHVAPHEERQDQPADALHPVQARRPDALAQRSRGTASGCPRQEWSLDSCGVPFRRRRLVVTRASTRGIFAARGVVARLMQINRCRGGRSFAYSRACSGVQALVLGLQLFARFGVFRVGNDAVGRADEDALRLVVRADALRALGRIDDVDRRADG